MDTQTSLGKRYGAILHPNQPHSKVGIALATLGQQPINGLRHPPKDGTSGWYIWGGERFSSAVDFFQPVHIEHLDEFLPTIIPYLGLPAGWRFQVAPGHEDVWFDPDLLLEA